MTNHEMIAAAVKNHRGNTLSTRKIEEIVLEAFPQFSKGSLLPNDHAEGNKSPCKCAGTASRIFDRIEKHQYRVRWQVLAPGCTHSHAEPNGAANHPENGLPVTCVVRY
jgi:hypothetical protein